MLTNKDIDHDEPRSRQNHCRNWRRQWPGRLICQKAILPEPMICDINEGLLNTVVQELSRAGGRAIGQHTDVSDLSQMRELTTKAVEHFGRIDVMVNNAGVMPLAFTQTMRMPAPSGQCIDIVSKGCCTVSSAFTTK